VADESPVKAKHPVLLAHLLSVLVMHPFSSAFGAPEITAEKLGLILE
jgi:hypothetical protein